MSEDKSPDKSEKWEIVSDDTYRLKVPSGWIYGIYDSFEQDVESYSYVFVPDFALLSEKLAEDLRLLGVGTK